MFSVPFHPVDGFRSVEGVLRYTEGFKLNVAPLIWDSVACASGVTARKSSPNSVSSSFSLRFLPDVS